MEGTQSTVGDMLRQWRQRRSMTQLALALEVDVSQRHLSYVENGRSNPSRELVIGLAEHLSIPLRERNAILVAAGFAPTYGERNLDDAALQGAMRAVDAILKDHEPFPALAVDRHWKMIRANAAVPPLLLGVDKTLLQPPVNVLRLSLHPDGLASRIANFREWRAHVLMRLLQQIDNSADPVLIALYEELSAFAIPDGAMPQAIEGGNAYGKIAVPLKLRTERGTMSLISATTVFGTALDVGLSELAIETFFPLDEETAELLLDGR